MRSGWDFVVQGSCMELHLTSSGEWVRLKSQGDYGWSDWKWIWIRWPRTDKMTQALEEVLQICQYTLAVIYGLGLSKPGLFMFKSSPYWLIYCVEVQRYVIKLLCVIWTTVVSKFKECENKVFWCFYDMSDLLKFNYHTKLWMWENLFFYGQQASCIVSVKRLYFSRNGMSCHFVLCVLFLFFCVASFFNAHIYDCSYTFRVLLELQYLTEVLGCQLFCPCLLKIISTSILIGTQQTLTSTSTSDHPFCSNNFSLHSTK